MTWAAAADVVSLIHLLEECAIDDWIITISIWKDVQYTLHHTEQRLNESPAHIVFYTIDSFKMMPITFDTFKGYTSLAWQCHSELVSLNERCRWLICNFFLFFCNNYVSILNQCADTDTHTDTIKIHRQNWTGTLPRIVASDIPIRTITITKGNCNDLLLLTFL